ncbi:MAG: AAA family ATPase [Vicinamibacteria bacterium]|nr:AAA family ATPase [Vicinamibacteria bacterium]
MLKPVLETLELGPELCERLRPAVFDAMFAAAAEAGRSSVSVSDLKDLLAQALPQFREPVLQAMAARPAIGPVPLHSVGVLLHDALHLASQHFRREGAADFRAAQHEADLAKRSERLWNGLFSRRLLPWLQASGRLDEPESIESLDVVVEAVRLWVADLAQRLAPGEEIAPAAMLLDAEVDLRAALTWKGRTLLVRGRPDAVVVDRRSARPEVVEYKLGQQGQLELQVAQALVYLELLNELKGPGLTAARLQLFRLEGETPPDAAEAVTPSAGAAAPAHGFPSEVDGAFAGYIGNLAAVRRLKIECTLARRESPPSMPVNVMLCGPGGLGKTELARRVARALGVPLVDVPASGVKDVDGLLERVDATLAAAGQSAEPAGTDSGLPRVSYPPLVIFLDEIHLLRRKADLFLQMFEPKERRAVGSEVVGVFPHATFLGATTDKGLLPAPFLTRFRMVDLVAYSAPEVAQILEPLFAREGVKVDEAFLVQLAQMSRLNPREALERARETLTHHRFDPTGYPLDRKGLRRLAEESWQVDELGLREADRAYLKALRGGRRGIAALDQMLPVGRDEILTVIEPWLLQLELIRQTGAGRELTERGRRLIG